MQPHTLYVEEIGFGVTAVLTNGLITCRILMHSHTGAHTKQPHPTCMLGLVSASLQLNPLAHTWTHKYTEQTTERSGHEVNCESYYFFLYRQTNKQTLSLTRQKASRGEPQSESCSY